MSRTCAPSCLPPLVRGELQALARYRAAEFRSDMLRLGLAAMLGNEAASKALAEATADACVEQAVNPGGPGVVERYQATVEATALACLAKPKPGRDGDLPAVASFG